jgi:hypothetical protein
MPTEALGARSCEAKAGIGLTTRRCDGNELLVDSQLRGQIRNTAVAGDHTEEDRLIGAVRART